MPEIWKQEDRSNLKHLPYSILHHIQLNCFDIFSGSPSSFSNIDHTLTRLHAVIFRRME